MCSMFWRFFPFTQFFQKACSVSIWRLKACQYKQVSHLQTAGTRNADSYESEAVAKSITLHETFPRVLPRVKAGDCT